MTGLSTTDVRVRGILLNGAAAAYLPAADAVECCACGAATDTRSGYPVPTAEGERWACPPCNYSPASWNADESVFTAAVVPS